MEKSEEPKTYEQLKKENDKLVMFLDNFVIMTLPFRVGSNEPIKIECLVPIPEAKKIYEQFPKKQTEQNIENQA